MTLSELRKAYPHLFHPNQDWFENEPFMDEWPGTLWRPPQRHLVFRQSASVEGELFAAAHLFLLYKEGYYRPGLWKNYLWTSDLDSHGQRVYVGDNGKGFEIHRHIHLTARFGYPIWQ